MKEKIKLFMLKNIKKLAFLFGVININCACKHVFYEPKEPRDLKKYIKKNLEN